MLSRIGLLAALAASGCGQRPDAPATPVPAPARPSFRQLSSSRGELPLPGTSTQQTASLIADLDGDGVDDFVIGSRQVAPALVWYRLSAGRWERRVIDDDDLTIEAGGASHDIDGDGDADLVFGGDWQSAEVWWWENPSPDLDRRWTRRLVKSGGETQHHDQAFGDFLGTGSPQLAFWNQGAGAILLAEIPPEPRAAEGWAYRAIYSGAGGEREGGIAYPEGMDAYDVDGDGTLDLLAGNLWLRHTGGGRFEATRVGEVGGLIRAARFAPGSTPQIVISPGDGVGPLRLSECTGDPRDPAAWVSRDLLPRDLIHGHTLQVGDVDRDGHLDIFVAEMAKWTEASPEPDHPGASAWILYGDGTGGFDPILLVQGHGFHEGRLADLDGDGDLDVLNKPYNWQVPRLDVWLNGG